MDTFVIFTFEPFLIENHLCYNEIGDNMILFNMKKKLKREELLNSIDAKKFWNKSASTTELAT